MATIGATAVFVAARPPPRTLGLPQLTLGVADARTGRLRCSCYKDLKDKASSAVVKGAPLLAAASAMTAAAGPVLAPALVLALVDELVLADGAGMGDDLLGWILMVAFGIAMSYTVYSSILDNDDDDDDQSSAGGIAL